LQYAEQHGITEKEIELLEGFSAVGKLDPLTLMESWMRMVAEVINKAGNRLQFGRECRSNLLAQQSLLECSGGVNKLEQFDVDKVVDIFVRKWNEKVCVCTLLCFLANVSLFVSHF